MTKARKTIIARAGAVLAASVLASATFAQDANPAVKARQSLMQLYAYNLGTLGAMAQEKAPYDAEAAQAAAGNLATLTTLNVGSMWPAGTDASSIEGTRALPALWENMDDVGARGAALREAAAAMAAAAGTDLASLQAAMGPLGGACGGCHETYRQTQ